MSFRQQMPFCAACFDAAKAAFGDGVTLVYAEENGIIRGKKALEKPQKPLISSPLYAAHGMTRLQWYQANVK